MEVKAGPFCTCCTHGVDQGVVQFVCRLHRLFADGLPIGGLHRGSVTGELQQLAQDRFRLLHQIQRGALAVVHRLAGGVAVLARNAP